MAGRLAPFTALAIAASLLAASACDDGASNEFVVDAGSPYEPCADILVDYSENETLVCDDLALGVEELCGFELTLDVCVCATAIVPCVSDTGWLEALLACRTGSTECGQYISCLEDAGDGAGEEDAVCANPTTWECLTIDADAGA
jgi:hypothetical protein